MSFPESDAETSSVTGDLLLPVSKSSKASHRAGASRTHRACDRCRVKKSKCNGQQPCHTCKANERTCVFSALRRRDIRKWHCHMQDTVDEAIQRLYRACKESDCFPGVLPNEKDGYVTTENILHGMGFTNLDIGPRTGGPGISGRAQVLQLRTDFPNMPIESISSYAVGARSENHVYPNSNSDSASIISTIPPESPHVQTDFSMSPSLHGIFHQSLPMTPLSMSEQFQEAMDGHFHHHHHHQQPPPPPTPQQQQQQQKHRHQLPTPQQFPVHFNRSDHHEVTQHGPIPPVPTQSFVRPHLPYSYREQYSPQAYYVYGGGPLVSMQQAWHGHPEATTVSQ